jgi:hypothetical protein
MKATSMVIAPISAAPGTLPMTGFRLLNAIVRMAVQPRTIAAA